MLKISYLYSNKNSPSFLFYKNSLLKNKNFQIYFTDDFNKIQYDYDFLFIQGDMKKIKNIKLLKKDKPIILIEPRFNHFIYNEIIFDLILFNSIESQIFFSTILNFKNSLIYPPYPEYVNVNKINDKNKFVFTYHGNQQHIKNAKENIKCLLISCAKKTEKKIELNLIYNFNNYNKLKGFESSSFNTNHLNHSDENILNTLNKTDFGLVPQMIENNKFLNFFTKKNIFSLKFKETTNLGRHLVFSQFKIPILTQLTPSVIRYFNEDYLKYLYYDSESLFSNTLKMIESENLKKELSLYSYDLWDKHFKHSILNENLFKILLNLKK